MRPIEFKHQNATFVNSKNGYKPLPALKIKSPDGIVISCWRLSLIERMQVILTGHIWLSLMTLNEPLTPTLLSTNRKEVYPLPDDNETLFSKIRSYLKKQRNG